MAWESEKVREAYREEVTLEEGFEGYVGVLCLGKEGLPWQRTA